MHLEGVELPSARLAELAAFYGGVLGLPTVQDGDAVTVTAGGSTLRFVPEVAPAFPFHFAFNVPPAQWDDAQRWLQARAPLIADKSGETIFHSARWNADMAYFYDPAGHIGELIARYDAPVPVTAPFGASSLTGVSEIGLGVTDVIGVAGQLQAVGVPLYQSDPDPDFMSVGDEDGLFILVRAGRKWFPDRMVEAVPQPLRAVFRQDERRFALEAGANGTFILT